MRSYLRRQDHQLVHPFDYPAVAFAVPLARASGVPVVLSSRRCHRDLIPRLYQHVSAITNRIADAMVVNSASVERELTDCEGVDASRIELCHNGVDTQLMRPMPGARPEVLSGASW